ncbi:MAG: penicillin-binding transpeptidase domain-containing protein [Verrucomicrobiota bacterium]|nr:penicillin-binding transpeptidase domain-containing protein [Verrucomicrobiota bacterium]
MKILEQHLPESQHLFLFKIIFISLFILLFAVLTFRQIEQNEDYESKERKQAQRRIIKPGARGEVLDRNENLLIGNKANFSAELHLEKLKVEILRKKIQLRDLALDIRKNLAEKKSLSIIEIINESFDKEFVRNRRVRISGRISKNSPKERALELIINEQKKLLNPDAGGKWHATIQFDEDAPISKLQFSGVEQQIKLEIAGLFSTTFEVNSLGVPKPSSELTQENNSWIEALFSEQSKIPITTNGLSLGWEARYAVVEKYLTQINQILGRTKNISMEQLKRHWHQRLVLPLELAGNLSPSEYASLIEKIPPDSAIQIQAKAIRHYPRKSLASHVLGYVGSGYEADPKGLSGEDLATFEIKGRKGKAGIEKQFDQHLRGNDGGDIWRVNPMGSRFELIERKASTKGKTLRLSLDQDLQEIAERSLEKMIDNVAARRILPDANWEKTILRRTRKALSGSREKELNPDLLISSFVDSPFPLNGKIASTVAGFQGTPEDATRLLRLLYSKGVLDRIPGQQDEYFIAPPLLPPAAAVLLDLESSEILVLATKPNYDLDELTPYISQSTYDEIQRREALLPRACHPGYAPASPFKLVTALAGIRQGVLKPNELLPCEGKYKGMECHVFPGSHGEVDLKKAIAQSCNVYFFRIAEKIGHQSLIKEAKSLGFDRNPKIELPSLRDKPIVPDPEWKKNALGVNWTLEDTFNISIGQGGLRQSPLQMACFAAKLAKNQMHFVPSILHTEKNTQTHSSDKSLDVNSTGYHAMIDGMHLATTEGTARRCRIDGVPIAGKTGTSQWRNNNMELNLAWFIGFAPLKDPKVAIAVLVEGVIPQDQIQGGLTATPIARDILQSYFAKYQIHSQSISN